MRKMDAGDTSGASTEGRRSSTLDGIRGLAAASVVTLHLLSVFLDTSFPDFAWVNRAYKVACYTPFSVVFAGSQAVTLFFVLSGFALHRMLLRPMTYRSYAFRRIIRLWIPYAVSVTLAILSIELIGSHKITGQSDWMNAYLAPSVTWQLVLQHALMVGTFNTKSLDFVIWSLVHEMRISLIFPVIFWLVERYRASVIVTTSLVVGAVAIFLGQRHGSTQTSLFVTFSCQTYFVIGSCLSKYERQIKKFYERIPRTLEIVLFVVALCLFCNCFKISATYSTMLGATWLITMAICSNNAHEFLNLPMVQHLGRVSYSLYLSHVVVLLSMINLLYPAVPFLWIAAACIPTIIVVAAVMYAVVERPSISLSRLAGNL